MKFKPEKLKTDVLIIGGGTAGCYLSYLLREENLSVIVCEKADIRRSGCLAAGVNALNAYITEGHTPSDYVKYAADDAAGIVRGDLLLSMAERLNEVTDSLEKLGLVFLKDKDGHYVPRGWRNLKINGENIKPLLAKAARQNPNAKILNHVNITALKVKNNTVTGATGFSVLEPVAYDIDARAVLVATGGAAGLYRPNNPGFSRHKMWYCPFNTGAGYAMGIRSGAEMTTFEMRFIALRCKDTIAPTGTIAQGVGAKQVNALGGIYEERYGLSTSQRLWGTVRENLEGRGPCYLKTRGINKEQEEALYHAYLNMAPSQTLKWLAAGCGPSEENVEIEGTEPYVVGGHTASGYWVDANRQTTVRGLFAAGDVAGGCPQKYVTGALAEAALARDGILEYLNTAPEKQPEEAAEPEETADCAALYEAHFAAPESNFTVGNLEEAMQKIMDDYAGGISKAYQFTESGLELAARKIEALTRYAQKLRVKSLRELLSLYELKDRLTVCRVLIAHLKARKETRWRAFNENVSHPYQDPAFFRYVNSKLTDGRLQILTRPLVKAGERYEHTY